MRDLLLGVKPKDFDIATNATPEQVKRLFRRAFIIGRRFQIVHVMFGQDLLEVTTFRGAGSGQRAQGRTWPRPARQQLRPAARGCGAARLHHQRDVLRPGHPAGARLPRRHRRHPRQDAAHHRLPEARYREDPVRMLRVVRFAAKLGFTIEPATRAPIPVMAPLINNVPAARVFDEMLKLLMSGHALACLQQLRKEGLHHGLLPLLDVVLEQPIGMKFVTLALDVDRLRASRPARRVSPGFLFASLLWHQVLEKWTAYRAAGEVADPGAAPGGRRRARHRRPRNWRCSASIATDMRDIWAMQPRFERRTGKAPYKLLEHPRFRAGYDFLLLRCESGEIDAELGEWWTAFYEGDGAEREQLLASAAQGRRRRRRRSASVRRAAAAQPTRARRSRRRQRTGEPANERCAYIGIGANLGDARANVADALARLATPARLPPAGAVSSLYRTRADRFRRRRLHQCGRLHRHRARRRRHCWPRCRRSSWRTAANGPTATRRARSTSTCCCTATTRSTPPTLQRAASAHAPSAPSCCCRCCEIAPGIDDPGPRPARRLPAAVAGPGHHTTD